MTPVKQEPAQSPITPSSALGARIAKYAFSNTTPTRGPVRHWTQASHIVKLESRVDGPVRFNAGLNGENGRNGNSDNIVNVNGRASPYWSPNRTRQGGDTGAEALNGGERSGRATPVSPKTEIIEAVDDIENIATRGGTQASPSLRRSTRSVLRKRSREVSISDRSEASPQYEREGEGESSDMNHEEKRPRRRQTRIRSTRLNGTRRSGLTDPETVTTPSPRRRPRGAARVRDTVEVDQWDEEDANEDEDDDDLAEMPTVSTPRIGRRARGYAGPETYQDLNPLPDILAPDLDLLFCGINPGIKSSKTGTHFAHPTNKFWRSLHYSGLTSRLVPPCEGHLLPAEFNYGLTVLVDRPTAEQSELSTLEMRLNALPFTEKILRLKPKVVCFVGKKIWDVYESVISRSAVMPVSVSVSVSGAGPSRTSSGTSTSSRTRTTVKVEIEQNTTPIKTEPASNVVEETAPAIAGPSARPEARSTNPRGRREKVEIPKFDWTEPRSFRLPHTQEGRPTRYTYFWVVPNTSGLERTPLAEQIVLFGHLNSFKNQIKAGRVPPMVYREFGLEGVRSTVDAMRVAAEAREQTSRAANR